MSRVPAIRFGAAAALVAGVVSGCSTSTTGNATPEASSTSSAGTSMLAPAVPKALPTDALLSNPCSGLSAGQVTQIGLTGSGIVNQRPDLGPECTWKSATSSFNEVSLSPVTAATDGLNSVYRSKPTSAYFEPTTINGYPGVYTGVADQRFQGNCQLWVGVTDQLAVSVIAMISDGTNKSNPCPVTARVAEAMVNHLQGTE